MGLKISNDVATAVDEQDRRVSGRLGIVGAKRAVDPCPDWPDGARYLNVSDVPDRHLPLLWPSVNGQRSERLARNLGCSGTHRRGIHRCQSLQD